LRQAGEDQELSAMPDRYRQVVPQRRPAISPAAVDPADQLVPLVREIHAAVGDLRSQFDVAIADLRAQIAGKNKSHYTVEEVAKLTGRAPYTVRTWIKQGVLEATRVHGTGPKGRLLVPREELQKLVDHGLGVHLTAVAIE
jgi:excisionase family DNA binding protein